MPGKSFVVGLCLCALVAAGLCATNVSFLVMETGLPPESAASQYSAVWENGLLEVFFESGHIVSNAPRVRLADATVPEGFPPDAEKHYRDAIAGGMDYFLIAIVDHLSHDVSLRLFSTRSGDMIAQMSYAGSAVWNTREERENIRRAVMEMARLFETRRREGV